MFWDIFFPLLQASNILKITSKSEFNLISYIVVQGVIIVPLLENKNIT